MWEKIKETFRGFMSGRYGTDALSTALVVGGLILYVLDLILGTGIISLLGTAAYIYAIFRMMSRNVEKRSDENRRFVAKYEQLRKSLTQARARFANRKEYKYFRCPECKSWIRLKRDTGEVTVTCSRCHTSFDQRA